MSEQGADYSPDDFLTLARRHIIDGSLEQVDRCRQALLMARTFNDDGDEEMTGKLLRAARRSADELNRQLTGCDPE